MLQIIAGSWPIAVMFIATLAALIALRVMRMAEKTRRDNIAYRASQARDVASRIVLVALCATSLLLQVGAAIAADREPVKKGRLDLTTMKADRLAKSIWPALSQSEVDNVTKLAKAQRPGTVKVFCYEETKCDELALSIENAFESAHWKIEVRFVNGGMIPPGFLASKKAIKLLTNIDPAYRLDRYPDDEPTEIITIGEKLPPAKETNEQYINRVSKPAPGKLE